MTQVQQPHMPKELPNLAGVATQDLIETIGTGRYSAAYINWSRTLELLRSHAPGWCVEAVPSQDGTLIHRAPIGGYLLIRFTHVDGTTTPEVPQAIMDNRNAAIPFEKITARDVTDTHRRGACLAAALTFGLAHELWAKMPLESGYSEPEEGPTANAVAPAVASAAPAARRNAAATREQFLEAALKKGLSTAAAEALLNQLEKNGSNYAGGITRLSSVDLAWVEARNKEADPKNAAEQW